MKTEIIPIASGLIGMGAFVYVVRVLASVGGITTTNKDQEEDFLRTSRALSICGVPTKMEGDKIMVNISDLSRIWRPTFTPPKEEKPERILREVAFNQREISTFFSEHINGKPFFTGDALDATIELLEFLDVHGDCPSVVNLNAKEAEKGLDQDSYQRLAGIPLYRHTLNVARIALNKAEHAAAKPKIVIAALACGFRAMSATYSDACRPPIPIEVSHPFRFKPATYSV